MELSWPKQPDLSPLPKNQYSKSTSNKKDAWTNRREVTGINYSRSFDSNEGELIHESIALLVTPERKEHDPVRFDPRM